MDWKPTKQSTGIEFDYEALENLRLLARRDRRSVSFLVRDACDAYLQTRLDDIADQLRVEAEKAALREAAERAARLKTPEPQKHPIAAPAGTVPPPEDGGGQ